MTDIINQLAEITSDSPLADVRNRRPDVVNHAQGSYDALIRPADPGGLSHVERAQAALRTASQTGVSQLIVHYRALLQELGQSAQQIAEVEEAGEGDVLSDRLESMLRHADLLVHAPAAATRGHVGELKEAGFSTRAVVSLSQLIAFVTFQARAVAGLRLLNGMSDVAVEAPNCYQLDVPVHSAEKIGFTADTLAWRSWLPTLDLEDATPDQIAVLEESTPTAKTSPYYLLLVQDVDALRERSKLYNAIMYGPRGLKRADRELAAVATSRINGCAYCASVHVQRYTQLTKQPEVMQRILDEGVDAPLETHERAIVDYAAKLTRAPGAMTPADLEPLRQIGLNDQEILDANNASAMFAWANRLMQTLGEPVTS
ncbi:MAG: CMD domain protein [Caldilineaceae bacterium]